MDSSTSLGKPLWISLDNHYALNELPLCLENHPSCAAERCDGCLNDALPQGTGLHGGTASRLGKIKRKKGSLP